MPEDGSVSPLGGGGGSKENEGVEGEAAGHDVIAEPAPAPVASGGAGMDRNDGDGVVAAPVPEATSEPVSGDMFIFGNDQPSSGEGGLTFGGEAERRQPGEEKEPEQQQQQQQKAVVAPLPLDWTRLNDCEAPPAVVVRYPWDVAPVDIESTDLTVVGTHGMKITRMGEDLKERVSPELESLILRSHLIRTMEGIAGMEKLELLELYDNMVDELRELDGGSGSTEEDGGGGGGLPGRNLRVLDMSYNVIRDIGPVSLCPNLQELYIAQNKIKSMKGLKGLKLLRKIDLGANRIRVMDGDELSGLDNLEELWLGKNKIERISGLENLKKLRRLDVQANRLTKVENLEALVDTLEELYLAHNGIDVEGASCKSGLALPFTQLNTLDMSRNRLTDTSPFSHLTSLTDLWISGNDIKAFDDIEPLRGMAELDVVYLEMNPVADDFEYRKRLAEMIPSLTQIDATMIRGHGYGGAFSAGGGGGVVDLAARMKIMQDVAIRKARAQEEKNELSVEDGNGNAAVEEEDTAVEETAAEEVSAGEAQGRDQASIGMPEEHSSNNERVLGEPASVDQMEDK